MFLSKLVLNPICNRARKDLSDFYEMKRTLAHAFGDKFEESNMLFRIENTSEHPFILVQSQIKPNWNYLIDRDGYLIAEPVYKKLEKINFEKGEIFAFKLRANPTKNVEGKKLGIFDEEKQLEWIKKQRADMHGYNVIQVNITPEDIRKGKKFANNPISMYTVVFNGYLQVTDEEKFKKAFLNGIGRSKRFGCGMLSLARREIQ